MTFGLSHSICIYLEMVKVFCGMPAWTGTQEPQMRLRVPTGISLKEALMELLHMELTPEEGVE